MPFDLKTSSAAVREQVERALATDAKASLHRHVYQTVLLAIAGLPNRKASIAYILGVTAGSEFAVHDEVPEGSPFALRSPESDDYAQGIKDALLITAEYSRAASATVGEVISLLFGGHSSVKGAK